jgi:hypothetical protein
LLPRIGGRRQSRSWLGSTVVEMSTIPKYLQNTKKLKRPSVLKEKKPSAAINN